KPTRERSDQVDEQAEGLRSKACDRRLATEGWRWPPEETRVYPRFFFSPKQKGKTAAIPD
ncbi:MAG TPA: hypothetical protein O0X39_08340, partial [Methanocorpusculum sp.]|nr:hypothetical protein [Methanocorpusculum sp.]